MIASWMLYTLLISILLSLAGVAAERALSTRGRPTRFVWVAALALSLGWPLAPTMARLVPSAPRPVHVLPFTIVVQAPGAISADEVAAMQRARVIDRSLVGLWITLSLLLLRAAGDRRRLSRAVARHMEARTREWRSRPALEQRWTRRRGTSVDGRRAAGVDSLARRIAACARAAARRGASHRGRSISALWRCNRRRAHAVERRALVSGTPASPGDRDGLRRPRAPRASVAGTLRHADPDDRAATLDRANAVCPDALGTHDQSRAEDSRDAHDDSETRTYDDVRRRHHRRRAARLRELAAIGRHDVQEAERHRRSSRGLRPSPLRRFGPRRFRSRSRSPGKPASGKNEVLKLDPRADTRRARFRATRLRAIRRCSCRLASKAPRSFASIRTAGQGDSEHCVDADVDARPVLRVGARCHCRTGAARRTRPCRCRTCS